MSRSRPPFSDSMQFGYGLITCQRYPGDPRRDVDLYREALELAQEAERLGFDSVWLSEHHFLDDAHMPSLLPTAAAIAARTSRIAIGTGLLLAPLYEPIRLAEDAATVDLISEGRLVLGLGQGWRPEEFEALRVPLVGRHRRLVDVITALRQAWSDGAVTGGEITSYPGVVVMPKPPRPDGPPIWLGGLTEAAIRRAGRIGDGFMATEVTPESFGEQVGWVREELASAGCDPAGFAFSLHLPTFAWEGPDAWERVRDHHYYVTWKYEDMDEARGRLGPPRLPPALDAAREEELRGGIVLGTADEVAEQIRRFDEAAGGGVHYIARLYWPGMELALQRESMAVFAERVVPALR